MPQILSLICPPDKPVLDSFLLYHLFNTSLANCPKENLHILADNCAVEILLPDTLLQTDPDIINKISQELTNIPIDINILGAHNREKKILIADMDSTMINQECIDELADYAGLKNQISEITERAMRGELNFEQSLRQRVSKLAGVNSSVIDEIMNEHISFTPGGKTLIATMKARGAYCALVSGGFTQFASRVAQTLGFDFFAANELKIDNGKIVDVVEPILGQDSKAKILKQQASAKSLDISDCLAVGDGANDLSMITIAGLGIAYHAKPEVAACADCQISHSDLRSLLYLQGIPQSAHVQNEQV